MKTVIVNQIVLPVTAGEGEAFAEARKKLRQAGINAGKADLRIYRKSVDARHKDRIRLIYSVAVSGDFGVPGKERLTAAGMALLAEEKTEIRLGDEKLTARPVIVGMGPCGLFAALLLARNGYRPLILERGGNVSERKERIRQFENGAPLDENTNIQFGAGGAGTFSDGKLITRVNDPGIAEVLKTFVSFGAPEEILTQARPHIGTDVLCGVVTAMADEIVRLGGEILYHTRFLSAEEKNGQVVAVRTDAGTLPAGALILAVGHSARDTYHTLIAEGYALEAKPFSVGMRIEHPTALIDSAMYGEMAGHPALGHAEYNLSWNTKVRGIYTFCMCPGGTVVAAASETGGVVTNGMSEHSRNGKNSNSAVVCSVFREDYGAAPEKAIEFQRTIERAAFTAGGGDYSAPVTTVGDFLNGSGAKTLPRDPMPTYMGGDRVRLASPESYLPSFVTEGIRNGIRAFDRQIRGFALPEAVLTGAETRTSAPVRILRDSGSLTAIGHGNLYPAGEGAGYAGGITSAALDGIRTAVALMARFSPEF